MLNRNRLDADRTVRREPMNPRDLAHLHALRMEEVHDGDDMATFMNLFDRFRFVTLRGDDTYPLWRTMLNDPDGALATAAYLEGVASTRAVR